MNKILAAMLAVLLVGVVLAGCLGSSGPSQTNEQANNQNQATIQENEVNEGNAGTTNTAGGNGKIDLSNIENLAQLAKLGYGIKCTGSVQTKTPEGTYHSTIEYYVKGDKYKIVTRYIASGQTLENVVIHPGDGFIYVRPSKDLEQSFKNFPCKWIKMSYDEEQNQDTETPSNYQVSYETPDQIHIDQSWECHKENIPDSMFQIEGQACTMEDLINMAMQMAMSH